MVRVALGRSLIHISKTARGRCRPHEPLPDTRRSVRRFGGPEVLDVVALRDPEPSEDREVVEISTAEVNYADTHQVPS